MTLIVYYVVFMIVGDFAALAPSDVRFQGIKQPCRGNPETAEVDPSETWAAQDLRSAKALLFRR